MPEGQYSCPAWTRGAQNMAVNAGTNSAFGSRFCDASTTAAEGDALDLRSS